MESPSLLPRLHTTPELLTRSGPRLRGRFPSPMAAIRHLQNLLAPLPAPLRRHWLQQPYGHIIINPQQHGYEPGPILRRHTSLMGVAYINLALSLDDPIHFLFPVGQLLCRLLQWDQPQSLLKDAATFARAVQRGFAAGYGQHPDARQNANSYLAAGLAAYLVDRRQFNIDDPALEKLLRGTVFRAQAYRIPQINHRHRDHASAPDSN